MIITLVLVFFPLIAIGLSLGFGLPYLVSALLIYFLPGFILDLTYGTWRMFVRHFLFAAIVSIPFAIIVDFIGTSSHLWYVPHSIFASRFMGVLPYEDFFWMIFAIYTMVTLYDYFKRARSHDAPLINRRMWRFIIPAILALACFFILAYADPTFFIWNTPWAYVFLGLVFFALPAIVFFFLAKYSWKHAIRVAGYFLYVTIILEIVGSFLKDWIFVGSYLLSPLTIRAVTIPYEELFFVGVIGPLAAIGFYEYFDPITK